MNVLVIASTTTEIGPFLDHYRQMPDMGHVDVLITGPGLIATSYHLARHIQIKRPGLVIQAGIAGCFDKSIPLSTVVTVKQDTVADMGVVENKEWKTLFDLKLIESNKEPYNKSWLVNDNKLLLKGTKLKAVNGITVNQISTSPAQIKFYAKHFSPVIESMEGAALHYVCISEKISFLQIRAISNYIAERKKSKWKIKEAIQNLNEKLIEILSAQTSRIEH